jgi:hypothetical protein
MKRTALIVVGAPALIGVLGLAAFLAIRSDLPDPVATHWGGPGRTGSPRCPGWCCRCCSGR